MAVSQIEEKILGRLAQQTASDNPLLSASLYQVLGLSILLSRKLFRAKKLRKLDNTRETKSLQLYHQIVWLVREGLSITEVYVLPYCQDGEQGPECRVMAAKLRASLYHVFCLFHNHPPVSQLSARSYDSGSSPESGQSGKLSNGRAKYSPNGSKEGVTNRRRAGKAPLRDAIPSMTSDTSYVTNPYAAVGPAQTPPPAGPPPPIPIEARRMPTRPPGLAPINVSPTLAAASFLLPPLNYVPMTREHFETCQHLAESLLSPAHALRLSVSLEHAAFLWDCVKEHTPARKLARRIIKEVYASSEGLDDDEFAEASALVQALGGIVRKGMEESTPKPSETQLAIEPTKPTNRAPPLDRAIAVTPPNNKRSRAESPTVNYSTHHTLDRLSTVPEVESSETSGDLQPPRTTAPKTLSPPISRLSGRGKATSRSGRSVSTASVSASSDKASKRARAEYAEELHRLNSASKSSNPSTRSREASPPLAHEGYVIRPSTSSTAASSSLLDGSTNTRTRTRVGTQNPPAPAPASAPAFATRIPSKIPPRSSSSSKKTAN